MQDAGNLCLPADGQDSHGQFLILLLHQVLFAQDYRPRLPGGQLPDTRQKITIAVLTARDHDEL